MYYGIKNIKSVFLLSIGLLGLLVTGNAAGLASQSGTGQTTKPSSTIIQAGSTQATNSMQTPTVTTIQASPGTLGSEQAPSVVLLDSTSPGFQSWLRRMKSAYGATVLKCALAAAAIKCILMVKDSGAITDAPPSTGAGTRNVLGNNHQSNIRKADAIKAQKQSDIRRKVGLHTVNQVSRSRVRPSGIQSGRAQTKTGDTNTGNFSRNSTPHSGKTVPTLSFSLVSDDEEDDDASSSANQNTSSRQLSQSGSDAPPVKGAVASTISPAAVTTKKSAQPAAVSSSDSNQASPSSHAGSAIAGLKPGQGRMAATMQSADLGKLGPVPVSGSSASSARVPAAMAPAAQAPQKEHAITIKLATLNVESAHSYLAEFHPKAGSKGNLADHMMPLEVRRNELRKLFIHNPALGEEAGPLAHHDVVFLQEHGYGTQRQDNIAKLGKGKSHSMNVALNATQYNSVASEAFKKDKQFPKQTVDVLFDRKKYDCVEVVQHENIVTLVGGTKKKMPGRFLGAVLALKDNPQGPKIGVVSAHIQYGKPSQSQLKALNKAIDEVDNQRSDIAGWFVGGDFNIDYNEFGKDGLKVMTDNGFIDAGLGAISDKKRFTAMGKFLLDRNKAVDPETNPWRANPEGIDYFWFRPKKKQGVSMRCLRQEVVPPVSEQAERLLTGGHVLPDGSRGIDVNRTWCSDHAAGKVEVLMTLGAAGNLGEDEDEKSVYEDDMCDEGDRVEQDKEGDEEDEEDNGSHAHIDDVCQWGS